MEGRLSERAHLRVTRFIRFSLQTSGAFVLALHLHRLRMMGMGRVVVVIMITFPISISATATTQLLLTGRIDDTSRLLIAAAGPVRGLVCVDVVNETLLKALSAGRLARHNEALLLDGSVNQGGEGIDGIASKVVMTTGGSIRPSGDQWRDRVALHFAGTQQVVVSSRGARLGRLNH